MVAVAGAAIACLSIAGPADAATQLGQVFTPADAVPPGSMAIQSISPMDRYAAPFGGIITAWNVQGGAEAAQLQLKVVRRAGGNQFTIVGDTGLEGTVPNALNTFPARIAVRSGDLIGLYTGPGAYLAAGAPGYAYHLGAPNAGPGTTLPFAGPFQNSKLDVSASLEVDCDGDKLGDETQDPEVSGGCVVDTAPPDTKIRKATTHGRNAKLKFGTNEPEGASFMCRLDARPYRSCESPKALRVADGPHTFRVVSIDAAGNTDPTPAAFHWTAHR